MKDKRVNLSFWFKIRLLASYFKRERTTSSYLLERTNMCAFIIPCFSGNLIHMINVRDLAHAILLIRWAPLITSKKMQIKLLIIIELFWKKMQEISSFFEAIGTPVLDFLVTFALGFKAKVAALLVYLVACVWWISQIHLWCCTCWSLDPQYLYTLQTLVVHVLKLLSQLVIRATQYVQIVVYRTLHEQISKRRKIRKKIWFALPVFILKYKHHKKLMFLRTKFQLHGHYYSWIWTM